MSRGAKYGGIITITPTVEASALDAGDVVFDATVIPGAALVAGGVVRLDSIFILDKLDQKAQLQLVFMNAATSLGVVDGAPDIDDTEAATVIAIHEVLAASYVDLGASAVYSIGNIGKLMKATAGTADLWVAAFSTGTPTYGAGTPLQISFGFVPV